MMKSDVSAAKAQPGRRGHRTTRPCVVGLTFSCLRDGRALHLRVYGPVCPSINSRRMSAWPVWRAVSSIMWIRIRRRL